MLAPNTASLLSGEPSPPLPNFPATPRKIPSTSDPRIGGAIGEVTNVGMSLFPFPAAGLSAGTGRGILGLLRRVAPEAPQTAQSLASRGVFIYNPPAKSPRPFSADYPSGAPADAAGRLTADTEGRPLTARYLVGRKVVGGNDIPFPTSELDALAEAGTGKLPQAVAQSKIKGAAGVLRMSPSGRPTEIYLSDKLTPQTSHKILAHENAHAIDQLAGNISTKGLVSELKDIYNTLNNPNRSADGKQAASWGKPFRPQHIGYKGDEVAREYVVEAIRLYGGPELSQDCGAENGSRHSRSS